MVPTVEAPPDGSRGPGRGSFSTREMNAERNHDTPRGRAEGMPWRAQSAGRRRWRRNIRGDFCNASQARKCSTSFSRRQATPSARWSRIALRACRREIVSRRGMPGRRHAAAVPAGRSVLSSFQQRWALRIIVSTSILPAVGAWRCRARRSEQSGRQKSSIEVKSRPDMMPALRASSWKLEKLRPAACGVRLIIAKGRAASFSSNSSKRPEPGTKRSLTRNE